jgi:hypothetical protein
MVNNMSSKEVAIVGRYVVINHVNLEVDTVFFVRQDDLSNSKPSIIRTPELLFLPPLSLRLPYV